MVSNPITCCSVMRWASTPRGMQCPQHKKTEGAFRPLEHGVKRDSGVSVMYAEELNSAKSSVTLQRTDRHDILGQKFASFQLSVGERDAECAPDCPPDGLLQKSCASSPAGDRPAGLPSR